MEEKIKIIVENSASNKVELTIPGFGNINDWQQAFRVILKWAEYTDDTVNELFNCNEFGEELPRKMNKKKLNNYENRRKNNS